MRISVSLPLARPLVCASLVLLGCTAEPEPVDSTPAADPSQVEVIVARFYDALETQDFELLARITTDDFQIVDGGVRMDFSEFQAFIDEVFAQGIELDFTLDRFNTEVSGDVAYTTLHAVNVPLDAPFHETVILRDVDGQWKVDRFHSTPDRSPREEEG